MIGHPSTQVIAVLSAALDGPVMFGVAVLATSVDLPVMVVVAGGVVGLLASIGAAWAIVRMAAIKASLDTIIDANAELRRTNDDLRAELKVERKLRADSDARTATVVDDLAERLVRAVSDWLERHPSTTTTTTTTSEGR